MSMSHPMRFATDYPNYESATIERLKRENKEMWILLIALLKSAPFNTLYVHDADLLTIEPTTDRIHSKKFPHDMKTAYWWEEGK